MGDFHFHVVLLQVITNESALKCSKRMIKVSPKHGYTGNGGRQMRDGHLTDTDNNSVWAVLPDKRATPAH